MIQERIEDNIVIATLDGEFGNSLDRETLLAMDAIVKKVNEDDELKGIVLTGNGKMFSSGFNLPMFLGFKDLDEVVGFFEEEEQILLNLFTCKKPTVAALNGHTIAGGLIYAMACDYRIIKNHPKIKLGMSEIKIGLPLSIAQDGVMRYGFDSVKKFKDIMFFGRRDIGVEEAKEMDLVDEIIDDPDQLIARAKEVIISWIDNPGRAYVFMKQLQKKEAADEISARLKTMSMRESLNVFFDPGTRKTLEMVQSMMAK